WNGEDKVSVGGTFFGAKNDPRIVRVNGRYVEAAPSGVILLLANNAVRGIVGKVGSILGKHSVNIASMSLSRNEVGGKALTVLNLDSTPGAALIDELLSDPAISSARVIQL